MWTVPLSHSAWHATGTQSTLSKANAGLGGQRLLSQHSTGWRRRVRRQPGLHSEPTSFSSVSLSLSIWFPRAARTGDAAQGILPGLCPDTKVGAKHAEGAVTEWMTRRSRPRRMMQRQPPQSWFWEATSTQPGFSAPLQTPAAQGQTPRGGTNAASTPFRRVRQAAPGTEPRPRGEHSL